MFWKLLILRQKLITATKTTIRHLDIFSALFNVESFVVVGNLFVLFAARRNYLIAAICEKFCFFWRRIFDNNVFLKTNPNVEFRILKSRNRLKVSMIHVCNLCVTQLSHQPQTIFMFSNDKFQTFLHDSIRIHKPTSYGLTTLFILTNFKFWFSFWHIMNLQ